MKKLLSLFLVLVLFVNFLVPSLAIDEEPTSTEIIITQEEGDNGLYNALYEAKANATPENPYIIRVMPGTYIMNGAYHIFSNTSLIAEEGAKFVLNYQDNMLKVGTTGSDPASGYEYENITVSGGDWDANGYVATMFKFVHAKNCVIENVTAHNLKDAHFVEVAAVDGFNLHNCNFYDMNVTVADGREAIQIDVLHSEHIAGYVHLNDEIDYLCKNITISGCVFNGVRRAIASHTAVHGKYFENVTITNNSFLNTEEKSILCCNMKNLVIANNYINGADVGIELKNIDKNGSGYYLSANTRAYDNKPNIEPTVAQIHDNTVITKTNHAILVNGVKLAQAVQGKGDKIPAGDYYINNVKIYNNNITAFGKFCPVKAQFSKNVYIYNNTINKNSTSETAVYVSDGCTGAAVYSNNFNSKTINAVRVTNLNDGYPKGSVSKISSNTFAGVTDYAIRVSDSAADVIESNTVAKALKAGIQIDKNKLSTSVNKISANTVKNSEIGIRIMTATAKEISSNKIASSNSNAIQVDSKSVANNILKNTITSAGVNGIAIKQSNAGYVMSNTITSPAQNGVFCYEGAKVTKVSANKISGAKSDAIRITESAISYIDSNVISSAKNYGINAYGSSKTQISVIKANTVSSCNYGIRIAKGPKANIYVNSLSKNKSGNKYLVSGSKNYNLSNLSAVKLTAKKSGKTIKLTWAKKSTVSGYIIYRSTKATSGFAKLGTAGAKATTFTDKKAAAGKTYYYRILPYYKVPGSSVVLYANYTTSKAVKR